VNEILSSVYIGVHVMHTLFWSDLMNLEFPRQVFEKSSNIKFHEIPSSGSRPVPSGRTDGQIETTKLIVVFAVLRTRLKPFNPLGSIASAINNAAERKVDISTIVKEQMTFLNW